MRSVSLALAVWLVASPSAAQSRAIGGRCKEACTRLLTDPRLRATLCGRCLTDATNDRGSWAVALKNESPGQEQLDKILKDADWQVRWGGLRALAAIRGVTEARQLAMWVVDGRDPVPCLTALHVAASRKQTMGQVLTAGGTMGPSAAALCWQKKDELKKALEVQLYSTDMLLRREAMHHLAAFLEVAPARVVLNAMATRAPATDESAAQLLVEEAEAGGPAAGAAVLKVATKEDAARVDRLLAVWARILDTERPRLRAAAPADRKEAISALSSIAPLGTAELEGLLEDPDPAIRLGSARAIARGEGKTLGGYGREKLDPKTLVTTAVRVRWADFLGRSGDASCAETLKGAASEPGLDETVRVAALAALGGCAGIKALPEVKKALESKSPRERAAAFDALAQIPRLPEAAVMIGTGLKELEPQVLAAAVRAAAAHHLTQRVSEVIGLLEHRAPEVRLASARSLVVMGDARAAKALGRALKGDASAEVREACARGLGELGGPDAPGPLTYAAERDASTRVKYVAGESLRKLGFVRAVK